MLPNKPFASLLLATLTLATTIQVSSPVFSSATDQSLMQILDHPSVWSQPTYERKLFEVGERLVEANHLKGPILFRISSEDSKHFNDITAYAESDHKIIEVSNRLFHYFRNDDELAAVLSHELAHISMGRSGWLVAPTGGIGIFDLIGNLIYLPDALESAFSFGKSTARFLNRGSDLKHEIQADLLGMDYMAKAGYDPVAMETILAQISSDIGCLHWRNRALLTKRTKAIQAAIASRYPQYMLHQEQAIPNPAEPLPNAYSLPGNHLPDLKKPFVEMKDIGNEDEEQDGNQNHAGPYSGILPAAGKNLRK